MTKSWFFRLDRRINVDFSFIKQDLFYAHCTTVKIQIPGLNPINKKILKILTKSSYFWKFWQFSKLCYYQNIRRKISRNLSSQLHQKIYIYIFNVGPPKEDMSGVLLIGINKLHKWPLNINIIFPHLKRPVFSSCHNYWIFDLMILKVEKNILMIFK